MKNIRIAVLVVFLMVWLADWSEFKVNSHFNTFHASYGSPNTLNTVQQSNGPCAFNVTKVVASPTPPVMIVPGGLIEYEIKLTLALIDTTSNIDSCSSKLLIEDIIPNEIVNPKWQAFAFIKKGSLVVTDSSNNKFTGDIRGTLFDKGVGNINKILVISLTEDSQSQLLQDAELKFNIIGSIDCSILSPVSSNILNTVNVFDRTLITSVLPTKSASVLSSLAHNADPKITKTIKPKANAAFYDGFNWRVRAGSQIDYLVNISNSGPSCPVIKFDDILPPGVSINSSLFTPPTCTGCSITCSVSTPANSVQCDINGLNNGESVDIVIPVDVSFNWPVNTSICNTASIALSCGDSTAPFSCTVPGNNIADDRATVCFLVDPPQADLMVAGRLLTSLPNVDCPAKHEITFTNLGPSDVGSISPTEIEIELDSKTKFDSVNIGVSGLTCTPPSPSPPSLLKCKYAGVLNPGNNVSFLLSVVLEPNSNPFYDVTHTMRVSGDIPDPILSNNNAIIQYRSYGYSAEIGAEAKLECVTTPVAPDTFVQQLTITLFHGGGTPSIVDLIGPEAVISLPQGIRVMRGTACRTSQASGGSTCAITTTGRSIEWNGDLRGPGFNQSYVEIVVLVEFASTTLPSGTRFCLDVAIYYSKCATGMSDTLIGNKPFKVCFSVDRCLAGKNVISASNGMQGSILIFPFYTSDASNLVNHNTRINITNTNTLYAAYVHLFWIESELASVSDGFICLTPNQTVSFLVSDFDPNTTGYLVAIAVDANGCPFTFNELIGDEFVKLNSGMRGNVAAQSIKALQAFIPCSQLESNCKIMFDEVMYERLSRTIAFDGLQSVDENTKILLVLQSIGGDLTTKLSSLGNVFGIMYNNKEDPYSFTFTSQKNQMSFVLSNAFPRLTPRLSSIIPAGATGWIKLYTNNKDTNALSACLITNSATNFGGALNPFSLSKTNSELVIPVIRPDCAD